ncbi:MAG: hypothetical protein IV086_10390 [Hyphomonadaceae bacterium]|nr:hypothetical protein [Hyphomonadaceae bacterium]
MRKFYALVCLGGLLAISACDQVAKVASVANPISCTSEAALASLSAELRPLVVVALKDAEQIPPERRMQLMFMGEEAVSINLAAKEGESTSAFDRTVTLVSAPDSASCEGDIVITNPITFGVSDAAVRHRVENEVVLGSAGSGVPTTFADTVQNEAARQHIESALQPCVQGAGRCQFIRADAVSYKLTPNTAYLSTLSARAHLTYSVSMSEQRQVITSIVSSEWVQATENDVFSYDFSKVLAEGERTAQSVCAAKTDSNSEPKYERVACPN